jgi:hypothetical protein
VDEELLVTLDDPDELLLVPSDGSHWKSVVSQTGAVPSQKLSFVHSTQ